MIFALISTYFFNIPKVSRKLPVCSSRVSPCQFKLQFNVAKMPATAPVFTFKHQSSSNLGITREIVADGSPNY